MKKIVVTLVTFLILHCTAQAQSQLDFKGLCKGLITYTNLTNNDTLQVVNLVTGEFTLKPLYNFTPAFFPLLKNVYIIDAEKIFEIQSVDMDNIHFEIVRKELYQKQCINLTHLKHLPYNLTSFILNDTKNENKKYEFIFTKNESELILNDVKDLP